MHIYGLKTCDTCRKALKSLSGASFVDVRTEGVPDEVMRRAIEQFGEKVINTRSTTWRTLDADARAGAPLDLLKQHPTLMKRPLIQDGDTLYLGWGKDVQTALGVG
ncbi:MULTISPECIES: arsenate reductase family protein [unclassified Marinovum]